MAYPGFQRGGCLRSGPIRKVGGGGGQSTSGPIYESGGKGGPIRFRSDTKSGGGGERVVSYPDPDSHSCGWITSRSGDVIHPQLWESGSGYETRGGGGGGGGQSASGPIPLFGTQKIPTYVLPRYTSHPLPLQLGGMGERCKPQKLRKFRDMKLPNNKDRPQNANAFARAAAAF